jgi:hypothetical protein
MATTADDVWQLLVDMSPELRQKTLQEGFYVARIHDEVFELDTPENFQPQSY